MRFRIVSIGLTVLAMLVMTPLHSFAATCFCKVTANGTEVAKPSKGGFIQVVQKEGCKNYCRGVWDSKSDEDFLAWAKLLGRCGDISLKMDAAIGTAGYEEVRSRSVKVPCDPVPAANNPCCPPWNRDRLAEMLFYQGSGSISADYTLKFQPTAALKGQIQAYIDYLHTVNPAMQGITIAWSLHNQGTGTAPSTPPGTPMGAPVNTTWSSPGTGNPVVVGDQSFFSLPMKVGTWYRVQTRIFLENRQAFFPDLCVNNEIWVRVQVLKNAARAPVLEIWGRDNLIRRVPLKNLAGG